MPISPIYNRKALFIFLFLFSFHSLLAQPTISSFSPISGPIGTSVTISGSNFSSTPANNIVFFGAVKATVTAASANSLTVTAPAGATYQPVTVTVGGLTAYSARPFIITFTGGTALSSNSFGTRQDFNTDLQPQGIALADFDGDGKSDVATSNNYNTAGAASVSVLRNTSSSPAISFAPKQDHATGGVTYAIASGDVDGDGKPDLVSTSITNISFSVFRNTSSPGTISFAPKIDFTTSSSPLSVCIGDIDKDGKADIVVLNSSAQTISVFRNTGSIGSVSFAPKVDFATALSPQSLALADIDGDGKTDIAFTNKFSNSFSVYRNTSTSGNISMAPRTDIASGAGNETFGISIADIDGDLKPDVAISFSNSSSGGGLQLFRNTSSAGSILLTLNSSLTGGLPSFTYFHSAFNDLNGDGKPDVALAVTTTSGVTRIYQNNSSPGVFSFGTINNLQNSFAAYGVMIGDLDGDGRSDIVESEFTLDKISVFKNNCGSPIISFFSPSVGTTNTVVTILGSQFTGTTSVKFGGIPAASFGVVNDGRILATVGSGATGDVEVTNALGTGSLSGFTFSGPPTITSFSPTIGFNSTVVTITGTNFHNVSAVNFGGVPAASYTVVNPTTISAVVGTGASGSVSVTNSFGTASLAGFTYAPIPIIFSFTPTTAATGATVSISGLNFTGTTAVSFGGVSASSFIVVNANTITAVVGNGATGDVVVTNAFGTGQKSGFTYIPPPIISSFTPTSAGSGTTVVISGSNFNNVTNVRFGVINASSYNVINSTTINAVVGGGSSGSVSVTASGGTGTLGGFIYIPAPTITSFTPVRTGAGTTVTISGTNFTGATAVSFGGTAASSFTVVNPTTITAVVGGGASGNINVVTPGGTGLIPGFEFVVVPIIHTVSPQAGPIGTTVTLTGANFANGASNNVVYFGGVKGNVISATPNTITATVPAGATNRPITVLSLPSSQSAMAEYSFKVTFPGDPNAFNANSFAAKMSFDVGINPKDIDLGDIDGDGKLDIVVTNYNSTFISIFRNTSSSGLLSFASRMDISIGLYVNDAVIYDIDNDGKLDLALIKHEVPLTNNSDLVVLINNSTPGSIAFNPAQSFFTVDPVMNLAVGDLDGDGKPELVGVSTASSITNGGFITVFRNTSSGGNLSFLASHNTFPASTPGGTVMEGIEVRDLDKNNKPEVMIGTGGGGSEALVILKNTTSNPGAFTYNTVVIGSFFGSGDFSFMPFADDLDADGKTDVIATNNINIHAGNLSFTRQRNLLLGKGATADFNGDGKPDIVTTSTLFSPSRNLISVFKNLSTPSSISFAIPFTYTSYENVRIQAGDLDGDGKPEIATADHGLNSISIYRNRIAEPLPSPPTITSFTPTSAGQGGQVTINGTNFSQVTNVSFGNVSASFFTVSSPTSILASVGTGASGSVSVTNPGGTASLAGFTFVTVPVITSFTPASAGAGATVTITGTGFTGATAVSFGGTAAASFNVVNATTITAVVGTGASGNVSVTTSGGIASLAGFTFIPSPTITSFTPTTAGTGATVTVTGMNFTGATAVSFGGTAAASFNVVNATTITAVVAAGTSGNVSVTTPGGTASLSGFTFIPPPTISSFTPTSGGPGVTITITGTNFTGATAVSFGGTAANSFNVINSTTISAVVASGASGNVSITTAGGIANMAGFTFIPGPVINSFAPTSGFTGTVITITGSNFTGASSVSFGGVPASSFTVVNANTITAIVGSGATGIVTITAPGGTVSQSGFTFQTVTSVGGPGSGGSPELTVLPNPGIDKVVVRHPLSIKNSTLKLVDVSGKTVETVSIPRNTSQTTLGVRSYATGIYTLIWIGDKGSYWRNLIISR
jgi:hypothetical protein